LRQTTTNCFVRDRDPNESSRISRGQIAECRQDGRADRLEIVRTGGKFSIRHDSRIGSREPNRRSKTGSNGCARRTRSSPISPSQRSECCKAVRKVAFESWLSFGRQSCVPTNSSLKQMTLPNLKFFHLKKACEAAVHRVVEFISDHHNPLIRIPPKTGCSKTDYAIMPLQLGKL
jgi:hypothetical protein